MELRDFTEIEKEELNNIIYDTENIDTFQILLGLIAMDLAEANDNVENITLEYLCSKIAVDLYPKDGPPAILGVIHTWILESMIYKDMGFVHELNPETRGLKSSIRAAVFGLIDAVCNVSDGMTGKKQMDMWKFFEVLNEDLYEKKGMQMRELPYETMQYIVTCLDYLGFKRVKRDKPVKVNVSKLPWEGTVF